jgi:hypothetical protein
MSQQCDFIKRNGSRCGGNAMRGERTCGPHTVRPMNESRYYGPSEETGRWYFDTIEARDAWLAERRLLRKRPTRV